MLTTLLLSILSNPFSVLQVPRSIHILLRLRNKIHGSKSYHGYVMETSTITKRTYKYGKDSGGFNKIIMKKQGDLKWFTGSRVEASLSGPNPSWRKDSRVQSLDLNNVQRGTGKNDIHIQDEDSHLLYHYNILLFLVTDTQPLPT